MNGPSCVPVNYKGEWTTSEFHIHDDIHEKGINKGEPEGARSFNTHDKIETRIVKFDYHGTPIVAQLIRITFSLPDGRKWTAEYGKEANGDPATITAAEDIATKQSFHKKRVVIIHVPQKGTWLAGDWQVMIDTHQPPDHR
jgi:hypothetical protein